MDTSNPEYEFLLTLAWRTFLLAVAGFGFSSVVLGNLPIVPVVSPDLPGALANAGRLATLVVALAYLSLRLEAYRAEKLPAEPDDATGE
ncbi:hypothetical protein [Haloarchaeobius amylolyticus]|uniref:hypothetical protein n=1 Tax=Haloarchaeobius amylolyticus TaxID=1198296 RepID=UPI002271A78B|nr:hypothetical protein [Haloarchaeobius amylolyticus]